MTFSAKTLWLKTIKTPEIMNPLKYSEKASVFFLDTFSKFLEIIQNGCKIYKRPVHTRFTITFGFMVISTFHILMKEVPNRCHIFLCTLKVELFSCFDRGSVMSLEKRITLN